MGALFDKVRRRLGRLSRPNVMSDRNDAGILSISFDDFPKSAWEVGGRVLRDHGVHATYFACGGLCGTRFGGQVMFDECDLKAVVAEGHEVGCHTYDHVSALRRPPRDLIASCERNAKFFAERFDGLRLVSFAYPYGDAPLGAKRAMTQPFACSRGVVGGLNSRRLNLNQLKAVALTGGTASVAPLIAAAARERAWLIVFTHDVSDAPSPHGCKPDELAGVIECAHKAGLKTLTIKDGLAARGGI